MSHPIRVLWSVPRSVSTSFERMMTARGDHTVLDEPFSYVYYYGPGKHSERYDEVLPRTSPEETLERIEEAAQERPVFVKDMAYQALDLLSPDLLARFDNSFLIRHPAATLRSYAKHWPDFTAEEAGWEHLARAADIVEHDLGEPLVVMDSELLCRDPESVVGQWCERMGIEFLPEALAWDPGMRPEWEVWDEWHQRTATATGFDELDPPPPPPGPDEPHLHEIYRAALPVYERLAPHALGREGPVRAPR